MEPIGTQLSSSLYTLKALCILGVISAHMPLGAYNVLGMGDNLFGKIGVVGFFVVAGYLLDDKRSHRSFWLRKFKTVVLPWLFCGTLTFLIMRQLSGGYRGSYAGWILGSNTWLYFIPMLLLCFALFRLTRAPRLRTALVLLGVASNLLTALGLLHLTGFVTDSLNVLNWVPYFGVGALLRGWSPRYDIAQVVRWSAGKRLSAAGLTVFMGILSAMTSTRSFWGGWLSIPFELSAVLTLLVAASLARSRVFVWIGKVTYPVYLLHMPLAGIANTRLGVPPWAYFVKPLVVLAAMSLALALFSNVTRHLKLDKIAMLVGVRPR